MRKRPTDKCKLCNHKRSEHAPTGPKKPHEKGALYAKQLASTIKWYVFPRTNGPYTLFTTTTKAYCEHPLCTSCGFTGFVEPKTKIDSLGRTVKETTWKKTKESTRKKTKKNVNLVSIDVVNTEFRKRIQGKLIRLRNEILIADMKMASKKKT